MGRSDDDSESWGKVKDDFFKYFEGLLFRRKTIFGQNKIEVWRGKIKFRMLKMCVNGYFRDGRRSPWTPGNALRRCSTVPA